MRCFIAIDVSFEIKKEIKNIQEKLKKKVLFTGKFTESENLHLTLKFLGEVDEEEIEKVKEKLREIKFEEFETSIGELGVFSRSFSKIIWIKLLGFGIWDLQKKIDSVLKDLFPVEERFMGHVTIARVKNVSDKKTFLEYLKSIKPKNLKFKVNEFSLKKSELLSEGPVYEDLETYKAGD